MQSALCEGGFDCVSKSADAVGMNFGQAPGRELTVALALVGDYLYHQLCDEFIKPLHFSDVQLAAEAGTGNRALPQLGGD